MTQKAKKHEAGFTLLEVVGALIIGGVVFSLVALAISSGMNSARVSAAQESLSYLRMNIHDA